MSKIINSVKDEQPQHEYLSQQEKEIMELVSQGKTNREISELLMLSEKTVRNNVSKLLKKLNATNRTEAAMYWQRMKMLK